MEIDEFRERFLKLDTACVCDAYPEIRHLDSTIRLVNPGKKLVGVAYTVYSEGDIMPVVMALQKAVRGEVLVIDSCGGERALFGELMVYEAKQKGLAGIVSDGACRDIDGIRTIGLPVYSRLVCPHVADSSIVGKSQVSVSVCGVEVVPGDIMFGDADGVVVLSPGKVAEVVPLAEDIQSKEGLLLERLSEGESLFNFLNADEHYQNLQANKDSKLTLFRDE